jgi:hypothetical protein
MKKTLDSGRAHDASPRAFVRSTQRREQAASYASATASQAEAKPDPPRAGHDEIDTEEEAEDIEA